MKPKRVQTETQDEDDYDVARFLEFKVDMFKLKDFFSSEDNLFFYYLNEFMNEKLKLNLSETKTEAFSGGKATFKDIFQLKKPEQGVTMEERSGIESLKEKFGELFGKTALENLHRETKDNKIEIEGNLLGFKGCIFELKKALKKLEKSLSSYVQKEFYCHKRVVFIVYKDCSA